MIISNNPKYCGMTRRVSGKELHLCAARVAIRELPTCRLIRALESKALSRAEGSKVIDITGDGNRVLDDPAAPQININVFGGAHVGAIQVGNDAMANTTQFINSTAHPRDADTALSPAAAKHYLDDASEEAPSFDSDDPSSYPLLTRSSTALFSERFAKAFPGVRGTAMFEPPHAIERLAILLSKPLAYRTGDYAYVDRQQNTNVSR